MVHVESQTNPRWLQGHDTFWSRTHVSLPHLDVTLVVKTILVPTKDIGLVWPIHSSAKPVYPHLQLFFQFLHFALHGERGSFSWTGSPDFGSSPFWAVGPHRVKRFAQSFRFRGTDTGQDNVTRADWQAFCSQVVAAKDSKGWQSPKAPTQNKQLVLLFRFQRALGPMGAFSWLFEGRNRTSLAPN